jgi:hypothetical protein
MLRGNIPWPPVGGRGPLTEVNTMRRPGSFLPAIALALALPLAASARTVRLLDDELVPPQLRTPSLSLLDGGALALASDPAKQPAEKPAEKPPAAKPPPKSDGMDFDLLGEAKPAEAPVDVGALKLRRRMLEWHQALGFGLLALDLATTVVGQLNYNDKFGDANTGQYRQPHMILAYTTVGVFLLEGALALFAPSPIKKPHEGWDRVSTHKASMFVAALGMAAQIGLGIYTAQREGYLNQKDIGTIHLAVGYATLAALGVGFGALVF